MKLNRTFVLSALATMTFAPAAMADTSATVELGGGVTSILAIEASTLENAELLPLDGQGSSTTHTVDVAHLFIITNNEQGYTLTASQGSLTKAGGTSIPYQVSTLASGDVTGTPVFAPGISYTYGNSSAGADNRDLYIQYTPASLQDPGYYGDVIQLTVKDN